MRSSILCFAAAAVAALSTPALAESYHPYVGVITGYDHVQVSDPYGSGSKDGVVYGGLAGIDYSFGGGVVGAEIEGTGSSTKQSAVFSPTLSGSISAGRDLYVGARAGAVLLPHTLMYLKGGFTNAKVNGSITSSGTTYSGSTNLNGWRVGAGVETAMRRVRFRAEYRYSDYGQYDLFGISTGIDTKRHQVVLGALLDL
jgi:outer membrane immunogenic protein